MSNFGQHAYEDYSMLNAEWGQARPPMAGLGASGTHEYVDVSYLNARLRPIEPKRFGMGFGIGNGSGNGTLSGNSLGVLRGFGADPDYPWGEYSADTKALQQVTNEALSDHGYIPLTADGKLGAKTCGAIRAMCGESGQSCDAPGTCQSFTAPTKVGAGGSRLVSTKPAPVSRAGMFGGGGGTNWLLVGGAIGAIAIGGALIFRAKR